MAVLILHRPSPPPPPRPPPPQQVPQPWHSLLLHPPALLFQLPLVHLQMPVTLIGPTFLEKMAVLALELLQESVRPILLYLNNFSFRIDVNLFFSHRNTSFPPDPDRIRPLRSSKTTTTTSSSRSPSRIFSSSPHQFLQNKRRS